jgi:hypothetical protein
MKENVAQLCLNIVNCSLTKVIHHDLGFGINTINYQKNLTEQYNEKPLMDSLISFYEFN